MTDAEKHEWCRNLTGMDAVILPPFLYDAAEKSGADMRFYVKSRPIPKVEHEQ